MTRTIPTRESRITPTSTGYGKAIPLSTSRAIETDAPKEYGSPTEATTSTEWKPRSRKDLWRSRTAHGNR